MSEPAPPDRALLDGILEAEGIDTSTSEPEVFAWLGDVANRALAEAFDVSVPAMLASAPWIGWGVLAVSAALAVAIVAALILRLARRRPAEARPPGAVPLPPPSAPPSLAEVERLLGAGDAPGALAALWRWVAAGVEARGYARPSPDRTNRELLAEVRRAAPGWERLPAFARLTNAVDGHLYGGVALDTAAVRALVPLAEQVVT